MAAEQGGTPLDVMLDLSLEDDLTTRFWSVLANDDPEGIAWLLPRDNVLLGLADSGAHVSQLCDACFSTDLLGNWVRDREVMPLERAIHKLTAEPAAVYGLTDRGVVEAGRAADLVVFDPDTVAPGPLRRIRDFPADGERLTADAPVGLTHTLVNGVPIRLDGQPVDVSGDRPGKSSCAPDGFCVGCGAPQVQRSGALEAVVEAAAGIVHPGELRLERPALGGGHGRHPRLDLLPADRPRTLDVAVVGLVEDHHVVAVLARARPRCGGRRRRRRAPRPRACGRGSRCRGRGCRCGRATRPCRPPRWRGPSSRTAGG